MERLPVTTFHTTELRGKDRRFIFPKGATIHNVVRKWDVHYHTNWLEITWSETEMMFVSVAPTEIEVVIND